MTLEHRVPDCTGEWAPESWGHREYARCEGCGAVLYPCNELMATLRMDAALREAWAAVLRGEA